MQPESGQPNEQERSVLDRFFSGLSEYVFESQLGVADVQLVDYVSGLMQRFVRVDATTRLRRRDGTPVTEVFQMLCEAEQRIGIAKREIHRSIGDFTLFWSGMYPERLRNQSAGDHDGFESYCRHGKRSYAIAAQIEGGEDRPPSEVLHRLSEQFELCAYGLREIRRSWEQSDSESGLLFD
ncbi:MAG: hypothetical protein AAGA03_19250 [Planctomycetota bacterium]